jgi:hypothetical protein
MEQLGRVYWGPPCDVDELPDPRQMDEITGLLAEVTIAATPDGEE